MKLHLIESSHFYSRRHPRFWLWLLLPLFVISLFLLLFSLYYKQDISIETRGTIEPTETLSLLQSTSDQVILENSLKNHSIVQAGQPLVRYADQDLQITKEQVEQELANLHQQEEALRTLEESIIEEVNLFEQSDQYGYYDRLIPYLSQIESLDYEGRQVVKSPVLQTVKEEKTQLSVKAKQLDSQIKLVDVQAQERIIKAPKDGLLLVAEDLPLQSFISKGQPLGKIVSPLQRGKTVAIELYVTPSQRTLLHLGKELQLSVSRPGSTSLVLQAKITDIASQPKSTSQGPFFRIRALFTLDKEAQDFITYGMEGKVRCVLEQKFLWDLYVKKLWSKE